MNIGEIKRRLIRLARAASARRAHKANHVLTHEAADIILRELLCGEPPTYFTPEEVRAFTEMVIRDLPALPKGWGRRD